MFQNGHVFSINFVYRKPGTQEYASEFVHNITHLIVTNDMTISTDVTNARKLLQQMGYTEKVTE